MPHFDNVTQTNDCCIFPPDTMSICMPRASWFNPYRKKRPDINFEILSPIDKMRIRIFFFLPKDKIESIDTEEKVFHLMKMARHVNQKHQNTK